MTLSTAEINTLLRACAWILYPDGHLYAETHELVESALAKLEAAINPNERQT